MERTTRFPDQLGVKHHAVAYYDFALDGGAISAIELPGVLPAGAVITGGFSDVLTTFTTAAADAGTIALHVQSAGDLKVAIAVSEGTNQWDAGVKSIIPAGTGATAIKLTADRQVTATIAVQVVTAGKLAVHLDYVMSPNVEIE